jgi:hypothetical protein
MITGEKLTVPFSVQLLLGPTSPSRSWPTTFCFAHPLQGRDQNPDQAEFTEVVRRVCLQTHVLVADGAVEYAVKKLYSEPKLKVRASYARDLIDMLIESASYDGRDPVLNKESFDRVFRMFLVHETEVSDDEPSA